MLKLYLHYIRATRAESRDAGSKIKAPHTYKFFIITKRRYFSVFTVKIFQPQFKRFRVILPEREVIADTQPAFCSCGRKARYARNIPPGKMCFADEIAAVTITLEAIFRNRDRLYNCAAILI